jgi:NAD(P)H-quinone oxidoreductase subunit 4
MLRKVFYGKQNEELHFDGATFDLKPRELFITACLFVPIVAVGLYPKLVTQAYDVKTVEIAEHARESLPVLASDQPTSLYAQTAETPTLADSNITE